MNLLVTGAAGFIGSNFLRLARRKFPETKLVVLDALTYAGNLSTLADFQQDPLYRFYPGKIQDSTVVEGLMKAEAITHIVDFAAESHNDRSLLDASSFLQTNVMGVFTLLEACRKYPVERFVHVSTDEVYGSIPSGTFYEQSPLEPNTPYSASKAAGDLLIRGYRKSYQLPVLVTRGGNTYGPHQFPEKLIPFFVTRLIDGKKVPLYGEGDHVREWIHAFDHAAGVLAVLEKGADGEMYNISDDNERKNRDVVQILLEETGRGADLVKRIPDPRKGAHDQRYSMNGEKLRSLNWAPQVPFEQGLRETVRWYIENPQWWRPLIETQEFQQFVARFYGPGLGEDL